MGAGELAPAVRELSSRVNVITVKLGHYLAANYSSEFQARAFELGRASEVLHTHGLWLYPNLATFEAAKRAGKPLVVSPRGMLAAWALDRSRWRKKLMWGLFQRRCLESAAVVHATSSEEMGEIRRTGVRAPVAMIPNGLDLRQFDWEKLRSFRNRGRSREILFLSRIHPKKGIDILLEAWRRAAATHPDARLLIAGPGEPRYVDDLTKKLRDGLVDRAEYLGAVEGEEKLKLLASAVAIVLPSQNENYGMVVAESLACGTPVVTTTGVPWPELEARHCGWRTSIDVDALAKALSEALDCSEVEIDAMGTRGRALVDEAHSAESAAARMEAAYEWACGLGAVAPAFMDVRLVQAG